MFVLWLNKRGWFTWTSPFHLIYKLLCVSYSYFFLHVHRTGRWTQRITKNLIIIRVLLIIPCLITKTAQDVKCVPIYQTNRHFVAFLLIWLQSYCLFSNPPYILPTFSQKPLINWLMSRKVNENHINFAFVQPLKWSASSRNSSKRREEQTHSVLTANT